MNSQSVQHIMRDKQLASLGDSFINFVYSLALTRLKNQPQSTKVSDRILSDAFRIANLRSYLGSRISRKDLANAAEAILAEAYLKQLISIDESVSSVSSSPDGPEAGLSVLVKVASDRFIKSD